MSKISRLAVDVDQITESMSRLLCSVIEMHANGSMHVAESIKQCSHGVKICSDVLSRMKSMLHVLQADFESSDKMREYLQNLENESTEEWRRWSEILAATHSEDVVFIHGQDSLMCPITLVEYVDPYMNPECGHSYSKHAISKLAKKSTIRCPVGGCGKSVLFKDLVPNKTLAAKISGKQDE